MASGPAHNFYYNVHSRTPPYTVHHPPSYVAPTHPRTSPYPTQHATHHPPCHATPHQAYRGGSTHPRPTPYPKPPQPPALGLSPSCLKA